MTFVHLTNCNTAIVTSKFRASNATVLGQPIPKGRKHIYLGLHYFQYNFYGQYIGVFLRKVLNRL